MAISKLEQETIINFNKQEKTADIETFNPAWMLKLAKLAEERPDDVKELYQHSPGSARYVFPKKWLKINPSRILTEERKAALREQLKINSVAKTLGSSRGFQE
jgi:hypothetical protein